MNLRGMIRLDPVEDLLSSVLQRLNDQDLIIDDLRKRLDMTMGRQAAQESFSELHKMIKSLQSRVEILEDAGSVQIGPQRVPVKEVSRETYTQLMEVKRLLANYSTTVEVDSQHQELVRTIAAELKDLRETTTRVEIARSLQNAQQLTLERLMGMETLLACKLDRSEVSHLETLSHRLENFVDFKDDVTRNIYEICSRCDNFDQVLATHDSTICRVRDTIDEHTEGLRLSAKQVEVTWIASEINRLQIALSGYSTRDETEQVTETVNEVRKQLECTNSTMDTIDSRLTVAEHILLDKATVSQVKACVLRSHFEEVISALGDALDRKASQNFALQLQQEQEEANKSASYEKHRVDIAMRFVDWFTSRGEGYEHNMRLIDKHLGKLTSSSRPIDRSPYTGQVKFAPVSARDRNMTTHNKEETVSIDSVQRDYSAEKTKGLMVEIGAILKLGGGSSGGAAATVSAV